MPADAAEVKLLDILRGDWAPANVGGMVVDEDVSIHHGWLNTESDLPEVTISGLDDGPIGGGETGYRGWKPDGSGPLQDIDGTLDVNVWVTRTRLSNMPNSSVTNPRQALHLMKEEVERILRERFDGRDSAGELTDIDRWSPQGSRRIPPEGAGDQDRATVFRHLVTAGFGYHAR